ncbi:hypothetical protein [Mucilaginibacter sp. HD30]
MFDEIKDFFKGVIERFSSPLLGSFVVAWLLINYEIPVTLIFYKQEDLLRYGYLSYIDVIWSHSSWYNFFWKPLLPTSIYVFVFPWIKAGIAIFDAWTKKYQSIWVQNVAQGQVVEISKFMELRDEWKKERERLEKLYKEETANMNEIARLNGDLDEERTKNQTLISYQERLLKPFSDTFFNGSWVLSFTTGDDGFLCDVVIMSNTWSITRREVENSTVKLRVISRSISLLPEQRIILFFDGNQAIRGSNSTVLSKFISFNTSDFQANLEFNGSTDGAVVTLSR